MIDEALKHLDEGLPEDEGCEESVILQHGTVLLLGYLWETQGKNAAAVAKKVPLHHVQWTCCEVEPRSYDDGSSAQLAGSGATICSCLPPQRVLAGIFAGDSDGKLPDIVPALVEFGMAIADPITSDIPAELKGPRLNAISSTDSEGVVVTNQQFSQIALLQPDVLNRCQESVDEAQALLGLVLCHVARHDPEWQQERVVKGRKLREEVELPVCGALWLADLKFRSWVPVPGMTASQLKCGLTLKH